MRTTTLAAPTRHQPRTPSLFVVAAVLGSLVPTPLLALPAHPKFGESLIYQFNGLVVVFLALGLIWGMMEALGFVFRRIAARTTAQVASTPVVAQPTPAAQPIAPPAVTTDPAIFAVVAAAVHATLGAGHRIVAVTPSPDSHDWSREGRRDHFHSHRVR